jgi:VPDSG-CTERM motif
LIVTFFDQAAHGTFGGTYYDGWVSQYGLINGGTFFFSDLPRHDELSSSISWNMTGAPGGYWMTMLDVFGTDAQGNFWENIYSVPWEDRFTLNDIVTLHDGVNISSISFYGSNTVPDTGSTLPLLGFASLGLVALRRKLSC